MNIVTIMGRLGNDPETKTTKTGKSITSFTLCANISKQQCLFWRVNCWDGATLKMCEYLKKGSSVSVTGTMSEPSIYVGRDGASKVNLSINATNISFCPSGAPKEESKSYDNEEIPF